jgi:hypothetical protein
MTWKMLDNMDTNTLLMSLPHQQKNGQIELGDQNSEKTKKGI